jgi:glycosyltransferase involved in cell wall biosynthesis
MMRSKILLHPSEYESQGYVFLEALASGMYVVCRDVGAPGASRKVSRCSTTREMADVIHRLLLTEMDHEPESVPSAADTVEAYGEIYRHAHSRIFGTTSHRS